MNKYAPGNTLFKRPKALSLSTSSSNNNAEGSGNTSDPATSSSSSSRKDCPLKYEELGNCGWGLLHTMAAYYPDQPSPIEQVRMKEFLERFAMFYPCGVCGDHMTEDLQINPPSTDSRSNLSRWMCQMHNRVNVRLGKAEFDCELVDQRWRDGWKDGSCD
jgi:FAD-linked sulfhydryl oxidase